MFACFSFSDKTIRNFAAVNGRNVAHTGTLVSSDIIGNVLALWRPGNQGVQKVAIFTAKGTSLRE